MARVVRAGRDLTGDEREQLLVRAYGGDPAKALDRIRHRERVSDVRYYGMPRKRESVLADPKVRLEVTAAPRSAHAAPRWTWLRAVTGELRVRTSSEASSFVPHSAFATY
jgi:hypothetical protein